MSDEYIKANIHDISKQKRKLMENIMLCTNLFNTDNNFNEMDQNLLTNPIQKDYDRILNFEAECNDLICIPRITVKNMKEKRNNLINEIKELRIKNHDIINRSNFKKRKLSRLEGIKTKVDEKYLISDFKESNNPINQNHFIENSHSNKKVFEEVLKFHSPLITKAKTKNNLSMYIESKGDVLSLKKVRRFTNFNVTSKNNTGRCGDFLLNNINNQFDNLEEEQKKKKPTHLLFLKKFIDVKDKKPS